MATAGNSSSRKTTATPEHRGAVNKIKYGARMPHFKRRLIMGRFQEVLPVPTCCDCCGSKRIIFIKSERKIKSSSWPYIWFCQSCKASVFCHPETNNPLGYMADSKTRLLRRILHIKFDVIWKTGKLKRRDCYRWLALKLNISLDNCHISWLTPRQLKQAILIVEEFLNNIKPEKKVYKNERKRKEKYKRNRDRFKYKRDGASISETD
jgi:hypothetical protein